MNRLLKKPYLIFLYSVPLIILIGLIDGESVIDVNVHDTYFVISHASIAYMTAFFLGIIGLGYWVMYRAKRGISERLTLIHILITYLGILIILLTPYLVFDSKTTSENALFNDLKRENLIQSITVLIIIFAQLIYIVNMIIGIFRKNKTSG